MESQREPSYDLPATDVCDETARHGQFIDIGDGPCSTPLCKFEPISNAEGADFVHAWIDCYRGESEFVSMR